MEQHFENPFEGAAIDSVQGAEIMTMLDMSISDLSSPDKYEKLSTVLKYVAGKQGANYLISKLIAGKPGNRLDNAFEYFSLRGKYDQHKSEMERLSKELELYER